MTAIESALRAILINNTVVAASIGTKVFPTELPQNVALPAVVYQFIGEHGSETNQVAKLRYACFADSFDGSRELGDKVRVAFERYRGVSLGLHIINVAYVAKRQIRDDETGHHICSVEIKAVYR